MNTIENKIAVGAPHSKARFENAHRICADCLEGVAHVFGENEKPSGNWIPDPKPYRALTVGNTFASYNGTCYVCEKPAHVVVVERNK